MKTLNIETLVKELEEARQDSAQHGDPSFSINENAVIAKVLDLVIDSIETATGELRVDGGGE